jgi:hypothetical protein
VKKDRHHALSELKPTFNCGLGKLPLANLAAYIKMEGLALAQP